MDAIELYVRLKEPAGTTVDQALFDAALRRGWPILRVIDPAHPDYIPDAATTHPIQDASESLLLAAPDLPQAIHRDIEGLPEALEAFRRDGCNDSKEQDTTELLELDADRVIAGVRWLRNHADPASKVHDFASGVLEEHETHCNPPVKKLGYSPQTSSYLLGNIDLMPGIKEAFTFEGKDQPELAYGAVVELFEGLEITAKTADKIQLIRTSTYMSSLEKLIPAIIENPNVYKDLVRGFMQLYRFPALHSQRGIVTPVSRQILTDLRDQLLNASKHINPEFLNAWLSVADSLPGGMTFQEAYDEKLEHKLGHLSKESLVARNTVILAADVIGLGLENVVARSNDPEQIIDTLHTFVDIGFTSGIKNREIFAATVLKAFLSRCKVGASILVNSQISTLPKEARLKAVDMMRVVEAMEIPLSPVNMRPEELDRVAELLDPYTAVLQYARTNNIIGGLDGVADRKHRAIQEEFDAILEDPARCNTTIFGRLLQLPQN